MKFNLTVIALLLGLMAADFAGKARAEADGVAQLRQLEAEFVRTTAQKGLDGFMTYFAEDGAELVNGGGIVTGKENIRQALGPWGPDLSLTWTPVKAEMAASGDLGYTYGTYVFKDKDKDGKLVTEYGKYATVWKKQKDGGWKVVMDMGNSSPAPKSQ
jgi:ketosteroid isomerase-like protein